MTQTTNETPTHELIDSELYTVKELARRLKISKSNLYLRVSKGSFPAPTKLGYAIRWSGKSIRTWLQTNGLA